MSNSLKAFRKHLINAVATNKTKATFAKKIGVSRAMIDRYLAGAVPGLDIIQKLADLLQVHPSEILIDPDLPRPNLGVSVLDALKVFRQFLDDVDAGNIDSLLVQQLLALRKDKNQKSDR